MNYFLNTRWVQWSKFYGMFEDYTHKETYIEKHNTVHSWAC